MKSELDRGNSQRRHHERAFKAKLFELSLQPGASVSAIAMEHGINANMLFTWRRTWLRGASAAAASPEPALLPVRIEPQEPQELRPAAANSPQATPATAGGLIEIEIAGAKLRLRGNVHEDSLRSVLRALRETA